MKKLDLEKIKEFYLDEGKTMDEIVKLMGVSRTTIGRRLKKLGIRQKDKIESLDKNKITDLYVNKKKSLEEIGKLFNIGSYTISKVLKEQGIEITRFKHLSDEERIINLYSEKKISPYKIAKLFNCSIHPIYDILKRNKIKSFPNGFFNKGKQSPIKGLTKETSISVKKISEKMKGRKITWGDKISKTRIEKGVAKGKNNPMYGKKRPDWAELKKQKGYEEKRIKAMLKGLMKRPTSYEQKICDLCVMHKLPFIYSGNGAFLIGLKNPDFKHKSLPILIEVYNDYHHPEDYEEKRREFFSEYGYKTIFINEQEVTSKNWENICLNKIQEFTR